MSRVIAVNNGIEFDDGHLLYDYHEQDCCEQHFLDFSNLSVEDFKGMDFDLSGEFFERVPDYGIRLIATNGMAVPIPGYGSNNGYYSSNLSLVLSKGREEVARYDITECQEYEDW